MQGNDEQRYHGITDKGCDDLAETYREGTESGKHDVERADDEETFVNEYDPLLKRVRSAV